MAARTDSKEAIRDAWIAECARLEGRARDGAVPLYMTLPGAEGIDIQRLIDADIISATETGALDETDAALVVAVEKDSEAILSLQKKFPGLRILEMPIQDLLKGSNLESWPTGEHRGYCRSLVVNLDFDVSLESREMEHEVLFPALRWAQKIAHIHTDEPLLEQWTLMLTFNASINWQALTERIVGEFLRGNMERIADFNSDFEKLLGSSLVSTIGTGAQPQLKSLPQADRQALLMAFVPKKLCELLRGQGWRIETARNIRYMGAGGAPMVTWILRARWDERAQGDADAVYRENVAGCLANAEDYTAA